jgi:hypothetical protein
MITTIGLGFMQMDPCPLGPGLSSDEQAVIRILADYFSLIRTAKDETGHEWREIKRMPKTAKKL